MMSDSGQLDPARAAGPGEQAPGETEGIVRSDAPVGSRMESARQPVYGQGIVVSLVAAAFLLVLAILAVREDESVTGIPATETTGPLFWGMSILFIAAIAVGSQFSEHSAARAAAALGHQREQRPMPSAWIAPVVGMAGTVLLVATLHNTVMFVVGPALAFFAVGGSLLARDLLDDATDSTYRTASAVHTVVIHVIAFVALSAVYLNKMSLLAAVPLVAIFSFLLILESLGRGSLEIRRQVGYAALGAWIMALATVFLNWWLTYGYTGGGVLLVAFYIVTGVLLAQTQRGVVRMRELLEWGAVSILAMAILIVTM